MRKHRDNPPKKAPKAKPKDKAALALSEPPATPPHKFIHPYGAEFLQKIGPMLGAHWDLTASQRAGMDPQAGAQIEPIGGALLLDTGATTTCIAQHVADALGLIPIRISSGFGAGGFHQNPVYLAKLCIVVSNKDYASPYFFELECQGIPNLDKVPAYAGLSYAGTDHKVIGLLGRDILSAARLAYDGIQGLVSFEFDLGALKERLNCEPAVARLPRAIRRRLA